MTESDLTLNEIFDEMDSQGLKDLYMRWEDEAFESCREQDIRQNRRNYINAYVYGKYRAFKNFE